MRQNVDATEMSVCVDSDGDATVFLTGSDGGLPPGLDIAALAEAMAARGLRLRGMSSSVHGARTARPTGTCTTVVGEVSLVEAVVSLIELRDEALGV